jgi:hypothetical protein
MESSLTLTVLADVERLSSKVLSCLESSHQRLKSSHQFSFPLASSLMRTYVYVNFTLCRYIAGQEMQDASPMLGRGWRRVVSCSLGLALTTASARRNDDVQQTMEKGSCGLCGCFARNIPYLHAVQPVICIPIPPSLLKFRVLDHLDKKINFKVRNIQCLAPRSQTYSTYKTYIYKTSESRPDRFHPFIHRI